MGVLTKSFNFTSDDMRVQAEGAVDFYADQDRKAAEFRAQVPQIIRREKASIDAALASGRMYVANHGEFQRPLIHRATCHTIRHQVDRDEAWESWLNDGSRVGSHYGMPNLVTRDDVEALPTYRACLVCNPDTNEREKRRTPAIRPTALRNFAPRHLGRTFESVDGQLLGELAAFTIASETVTLHFVGGDHIGNHDDEVIMQPKSSPA